jgi:hypothetical protein
MISIFDDDGTRLSVTWNGVEFNDPTLNRYDAGGARLEYATYSTPMNFHSEAIDDIVKNGGGLEFYNPRVGTRILNLRGSLRADTESELMASIVAMQRAFHPLMLQAGARAHAVPATDLDQQTGTPTWPPPDGLPSWVRGKPLRFTRQMPRATDQTNHPDGLFELQYHPVPLALPDPIKASVLQGVGVDYEAQFLLMDGGRSFDQTDTHISGNGTLTMVWGKAPVWPVFTWTMSAAGSANMTITTTGNHYATALVLDLTGRVLNDVVEVDTRDRTIRVNNALAPALYVSGDWPVIGDIASGATTVTYTNASNAGTIVCNYRESDYV